MPNWRFLLSRIARELWLRVAGFSLVGIVTALAGVGLAPWVPEDLALKIGTAAVDQVLSILASSMLAVATFSLATLVTAYTAVAGTATPRAATLLASGGRGQSALATFVGAFIYAVVGIFALQTGYYGAQGRVIVFFVTLVVLAAVVGALLRWVDQLSKLGQVGEAIDHVAAAAARSLRTEFGHRGLDAVPAPGAASAVVGEQTGFVRNVDLDRLERTAARFGVTVFVEAAPGTFVHAAQPLFRWTGRPSLDADEVSALTACWAVGDRRSYDQDPRFGMTVLGEIAAKALSPGVNDPGTALDVMATAVRLLTEWARGEFSAAPRERPHLRLSPLSPADLLEDVFAPIARYGAGDARVAARLQAACAALAAVGDQDLARAARKQAVQALERAMRELAAEADRERVRRAAAESVPRTSRSELQHPVRSRGEA